VAAKERSIQAAIQLACSRKGVRLFRNSTGLGYIGRVVERDGSRITLSAARVLHAGLVKGGSDLIGWSPLIITEDMIGQTVAVFTAVEVKTKGVPLTDDQKHFIEAVRRAGGRAGVAYNSGEAQTICEEVPAPKKKRGPVGDRASSHVA
jgi:hypothetical protein